MAGMRSKAELLLSWKLTRRHDVARRSKNGVSATPDPTVLSTGASSIASKSNAISPQKQPPSPTSRISNQTVRSTETWRLALEIVEKSEQWAKCCAIIKKRTGVQLPTANDQSDPDSRMTDLNQCIQHLVKSKEQSKSTRQQQVIDRGLAVILLFKDAATGAANSNPYAALGWGFVQYMVTVLSAGRTIQKECFEDFPHILDLVHQYQICEQLYTRPETALNLEHDFKATLKNLYVSVLNYQAVVVITLFSPMTKLKTATAGEANSLYRVASDEVRRMRAEWESLRPQLDREITDTQFRKVQASCDELSKVTSAILQQVTVSAQNADADRVRAQREEILTWISPVDPVNAHYEKRRLPRAGTADWLLKHADYVSWVDDSNLSCLWLQGIVGAGKSCLTHAVVNDQISKRQTEEELSQVLYFYCDGTDVERMHQIDSHERILRSFVKQLAASSSTGPLPACIIDAYGQRNHNRLELSEVQCLDLLVAMADPVFDLKIIIDGIDECLLNVQLNLVESLRLLAKRWSGSLKVFIACRYTQDLDNTLACLSRRAIDVCENNAESIRMDIEGRVSESMRIPHLRRLYWIGSECLADKVIAKLVHEAGRMFRFVDSAFAYLHASRNAKLFEKRLEDLGNLKSLDDLYDVIWHSAVASQDRLGQEVIITALTFVIHGLSYGIRGNGQSLTYHWNSQHILDACAFILNGHLERPWSIDELIAMCPSFLIAPVPALNSTPPFYDLPSDEQERLSRRMNPREIPSLTSDKDLTLRIPHVSVTQYLSSRHSSHFNPGAANARLAKLCLGVFDVIVENPDFEADQPNGLILYSAVAWAAHVRRAQHGGIDSPCDSALASVLKTFLPDTHDCSASFVRWASVWRNFQQIFTRCIRSFRPADDDDTKIIFLSNMLLTQPVSSLFARIYLGLKSTSHPYRACKFTPSWNNGKTTIYPQTFAAFVGQPSSIEWLSSIGYSPNERDELGYTSGHFLCSEGFADNSGSNFPSTLRALVNAGLDLQLQDNNGNTCFSYALRSEHFSDEVIQIFEEGDFDVHAPVAELQHSGAGSAQRRLLTPLEFGIASIPEGEFRMRSLRVLLSYYRSQVPDVISKTQLLFQAVEHDDEELAEFLILEYGADPLLCDGKGLIPLQLALQKGLLGQRLSSAVIDALTPLTLGPEFHTHLKTVVGFTRSIFQVLLRCCSFQTVKLFIEFVAPVVDHPHCSWAPNPITHALLFNAKHGRQIADHLGSLGCVNARSSLIYRKWRDGVLDDAEIGAVSEFDKYHLSLEQMLDRDQIDEDDKYWDAKELQLENDEGEKEEQKEDEDEDEFCEAMESLVLA